MTDASVSVCLVLAMALQTVCQHKENCVIFMPKQKVIHMSSSILIDDVPPKQPTEVKFLGVFLDEARTWKLFVKKKKLNPLVLYIGLAFFSNQSQNIFVLYVYFNLSLFNLLSTVVWSSRDMCHKLKSHISSSRT